MRPLKPSGRPLSPMPRPGCPDKTNKHNLTYRPPDLPKVFQGRVTKKLRGDESGKMKRFPGSIAGLAGSPGVGNAGPCRTDPGPLAWATQYPGIFS